MAHTRSYFTLYMEHGFILRPPPPHIYEAEVQASTDGNYRFGCLLQDRWCKRSHSCLGSVACPYSQLESAAEIGDQIMAAEATKDEPTPPPS